MPMTSMPMKKEVAIRACGEVNDHIKDNRKAPVTHITIIRPHRRLSLHVRLTKSDANARYNFS